MVGKCSFNVVLFRLNRTVTTIGRNASQVDYVINSSDYKHNAIISRRHARIVRSQSSFKVFDDSRNGMFVNDIKIEGESDVIIYIEHSITATTQKSNMLLFQSKLAF